MTTLSNESINRWALVAGAGFAMLAVMIGAFAAHGLKQILGAYSMDIIETAAKYQMYHAIALLIVGILSVNTKLSQRWLNFAAFAFVLGIIIFSGSLYLLALTGIKSLGMITPIGGILFILGWMSLIVASLRMPKGKY